MEIQEEELINLIDNTPIYHGIYYEISRLCGPSFMIGIACIRHCETLSVVVRDNLVISIYFKEWNIWLTIRHNPKWCKLQLFRQLNPLAKVEKIRDIRVKPRRPLSYPIRSLFPISNCKRAIN